MPPLRPVRRLFVAFGLVALVSFAGGALITAGSASDDSSTAAPAGLIECENDIESGTASLQLNPNSVHNFGTFDLMLSGVETQPVEQPLEVIMLGADTRLVAADAIPAGEDAATVEDILIADFAPGDYTVRACWQNQVLNWIYKDAPITVTEETPTPTPTPAPTGTPTPTATPNPTGGATVGPTATATPVAGPRAVLNGVVALPQKPHFEPFVEQTVLDSDPYVSNIEVTQVVQCMFQNVGDTSCEDNQIPLVARRITWVRVYLSSMGDDNIIPDIPVRLTVTRNGAPFDTIDNVGTARSLIDRNLIDRTLNFLVYCSTCNDGDVLGFRTKVDPDDVFDEPDENNNLNPPNGSLNLPVFERQSFTIRPVNFRYLNGPYAGQLASDTDYLNRLFPVPNTDPIVFTSGGPRWSFQDRYDVVDYLSYWPWTTPPDQLVAYVHAGLTDDFTFPNPLWSTNGQGFWSVLNVDVYQGGYRNSMLAMLIAWNLGRRPPCVGNPFNPDEWHKYDPTWPYTGNEAAGLDYTIQETGVDTHVSISPQWIFSDVNYSPSTRPDLQIDVTQDPVDCGYPYRSDSISWVSPYTYQQLYCALSPVPAVSQICREGTAVAIGQPHAAQPSGEPQPVESVLVSGTIDADGGSIKSVYHLDSALPSPSPEGDYCVGLYTGQSPLSTGCFDPSLTGLPIGQDGEQQPFPFSIVLPWNALADNISLSHGGESLDSIAISENAPAVEVTSPSTSGEMSGVVSVEWNASDADGDDLSYALHYSHDGVVTPVGLGITDTSFEVDLDELPGGDDVFFTVMATDNTGNTTSADSVHFAVENQAPTAQIIGAESEFGGPVNMAIDGAIALTGTGSDPEDGRLPQSAYSWTSSIDGHLADAPALLVSGLTPGLHTITLEVTDSDGLTDSDSIKVFVGIPAWVDVSPGTIAPAGAPPAIVTAHVELPFGYDSLDVDTTSVRLIAGDAELSPAGPTAIGDYDGDGLGDLLFQFDLGDLRDALQDAPGPALVTVRGELEDHTPFSGSDLFSLSIPGDIDCDGDSDAVDALNLLKSNAQLPADADCLAASGDVDCDGDTDSVDALGILRFNAGLPVNQPEGCPPLGAAPAHTAVMLRQGTSDSRGLAGRLPALSSAVWLSVAFVLPALLLTKRRLR